MLGDDASAMLDIALQTGHRSLMKRDAPALIEFGFADKQRVRVEVIKLECERFRDSHSTSGQGWAICLSSAMSTLA